MIRFLQDYGSFPPEGEIANRGPQHYGQAQPGVVRHEDQHEEVGQRQLQHVQECQDQVGLEEIEKGSKI